MNTDFPLLEHDYDSIAKTEPSNIIHPRDVPNQCVISFFREVNEKVTRENKAKIIVPNKWEDGDHPIYEINYQNRRLAYFRPGVGGPISAGLLEEAIAFGISKFIVCGGCGILQKDLAVGNLILVTSAIRDEGLSYHYIEPSREIVSNLAVVTLMKAVLDERNLPYVAGKTWTTDAPYRETKQIIDLRIAEGCLTVDMEAASLMAVAQFRNVQLGQILYAGDDLSGENWDNREWQSRKDIREHLFWLAADICLRM